VPTLESYLKPDVIQQVSRLDLKARFIVEGFIAGLHDSPYYGFSSEFSEHAKYNVGDEIKRIDWNVYARTDKYYIKRFQAETNLCCYLVVDVSKSMGFSYGGAVTKLEYATYMAAALAYLMVHQQDAVGLATFDDSIRNYLRPKSKRSHLAALLGALAQKPRDRMTHLAECINQAAGLCRDRGLVILFSDLIPSEGESAEDVIRALHHFSYRGHDVILFHVLDHAELTFPFGGPTRFIDVESGREIKVNSDSVRRAYVQRVEAFRERYREAALRARMDYVLVDTEASFDKVLVSYLLARKARF
jgi:uncharacterized protein (DUF58 family)